MKGWSVDPNAVPAAGASHIDSIIYATNSEADNFPVRGFMVGGTIGIWAYSDCLAPDFGFQGD